MAAKDFAKYSKKPSQLLDMFDAAVGAMAQQTTPETSIDKVLQFKEICKTIDRLKDAGAVIPDQLRRLKIELSHDAEEHEKNSAQCQATLETLEDLDLRLGHSLTKLKAVITRLKNPNAIKVKSKRYVKRTSPMIIAKELRKALRELGGAGEKADVLKKNENKLGG